MQSSADASRATPILAAAAMHFAQVQTPPVHRSRLIGLPSFSFVDSCTIKNGGCDANAICSHHPTTNEVVCTCKTGFTNTGKTNVTCTGTSRRHYDESTTDIVSCSDDCKINNGGCDINAECSHHATTNAVICTCKVGYTNTAPEGTKTVCTGKSSLFSSKRRELLHLIRVFADSCLVNNGGCDINAICSHNASNNAAQCTCKTGYTNTGSSSNVICTGKW